MNQSPAQQWSALSALYERADGLDAPALAVWLAQLEREHNPLLPQLQRMLAARAQFETNDFLGTLPKLASTDPKPAAVWAEGRQVGAYRLLRPLGEGGMAEVWLAERTDGAIKRRVAIKLPYPRPGRESFAIRFDRERDILATLRHPNIAGLHDAGVTAEGQAWLALEYVDGEPLSTWCDQQRLGLRERVTLFRQVLLAVQHAHANLVIHRDLKPANILVTARGEVRLLDFGIAKLLEAEGDAMPETELTRQAGRTLTPRYASPEQITGVPLTTASDVYSLGVVFYELISGARPYELKVESAAQLERAILETEPRAPSRHSLSEAQAEVRGGLSAKALRKALAPELDAIALRCLAKMTAARYSSVDAVIADIDRWLNGEAVLARAPGAWYRFGKFAARHRIGVGLGAAAVLSLVAVAAVAVVMSVQARDESARAVAARDFMLNIFKRADQEKSRGADITARDLLETGRKDVLTRLAGQPGLQAELLEGIVKIQRDMGENTTADASYADLAKIYGALHQPRELAMAQASRAANAQEMGNSELAQTLLQQARAVPNRGGKDIELEARLNAVEGWIAATQGDPRQARSLFQQSQRGSLALFGPTDPRTLDALRGWVTAECQLGNFDSALSLHSQLELATAESKNSVPKDVVTLDLDRAEILHQAGHYAETLAHVDAVEPRCEGSLGPKDELCGRLRYVRLQAALRVGQLATSPSELARIEETASDRTAPFPAVEALLLLFRLEAAKGASPRQQMLFERVRDFALSGTEAPLNPLVKAKAMLTLADAALKAGDLSEATSWIDKALALVPQRDPSAAASVIRGVGEALSGVARLQQRRPAQALESMQMAQQELSKVLGPGHPLTHLFSLNMALGLDALGRRPEAMVRVLQAEPILRRALGESSPTFVRVQRLKARLRGDTGIGTFDASDFFS